LVHLICLRCNRANPAEAKFCGECGAGLLRRFCAECHTVNDAESHFCQSCGAALPASTPAVRSAKPPPDTVVPDLTDVAYLGPDPTPALASVLDTGIALEARQLVEIPQNAVFASESTHLPARNAPLPIFRLPILLGIGAVSAALIAVLLWPAPPERSAGHADASLAPAKAAPLAATLPAVAASAPADAAPAVPEPAVVPRAAAVSARESSKPVTPRESTAPMPLARAPAALPKPRVPTHAQPAAHECTPQVDALGLCAPSAKVAER
jgi:ribosomal protein L40E